MSNLAEASAGQLFLVGLAAPAVATVLALVVMAVARKLSKRRHTTVLFGRLSQSAAVAIFILGALQITYAPN